MCHTASTYNSTQRDVRAACLSTESHAARAAGEGVARQTKSFFFSFNFLPSVRHRTAPPRQIMSTDSHAAFRHTENRKFTFSDAHPSQSHHTHSHTQSTQPLLPQHSTRHALHMSIRQCFPCARRFFLFSFQACQKVMSSISLMLIDVIHVIHVISKPFMISACYS